MKNFHLKKGLDIPLQGVPEQVVRPGPDISQVALTADDYISLKPTMLVKEGDFVTLGQPLFTDKKNQGVVFTAPGSGTVKEIRRGLKRKFEALIIELAGDDAVAFPGLDGRNLSDIPAEEIRRTLVESGLWCGFRTRPFGRIPAVDGVPASLFVTAMDTAPLAPDPGVIINEHRDDFRLGLEILHRFLQVPVHLCMADGFDPTGLSLPGINLFSFRGPHPAGLPSTHIHFIDPVHEKKQVWHICYQDVIGVGHLFRTGRLSNEKIIALGGPGVKKPGLLRTRAGASIQELCAGQLDHSRVYRILSGSVLNGRHGSGMHAFLGRYHRQVSVIPEENSRGFLGWLAPGGDRFSSTGLFLSSFFPTRMFPMNTAAWGGRRAIFPLGTYEKVMPLDIIATPLLKSLAVGDTEKSSALGCLELIEEDLALCSFVCPGKNNYGLMLRSVLTTIEREG
jgi:Na+-transporting NADH:ubiquinone oxidoreductase subunit A